MYCVFVKFLTVYVYISAYVSVEQHCKFRIVLSAPAAWSCAGSTESNRKANGVMWSGRLVADLVISDLMLLLVLVLAYLKT
jgi:hypothetical protein